jgi:tRNA-2-methylthio-N6-dimethylallyladenosine synthase
VKEFTMSDTVLLGIPKRKPSRPQTRTGRSYFIRTFGCQMNEHDSERIGGLLQADGMTAVDRPADADVVVLNTCTIRENADQRLYGYLGAMKQLKAQRPGMQIMVGGCMAQKDRESIRERAGWVDVVFGTHNTHRVIDLLDHAEEWGPVTEIWEKTSSVEDLHSGVAAHREVAHAAWVTVTIGCNNSCTFCIVPIVRGPEISRRPGDIVDEVRRLAADGVVEVTLLGQNVNSYGRDLDLNGRRPLFADLLRRVGEVKGIRRIRYTSPHPKDFREDVAAAMAETPQVCEQLHLPLQSGSDRILAAMHRGYRAQRFMEKLQMARNVIPDLSVSTDVIVGFPGETEADFQATLDVVAAARFDSAFMFQYSPRPGTPAATMDSQVPPPVVQERFERLVAMQNAITFERNRAMVGGRYEVLVEGPSKRDPALVTARTRGNKPVHIAGTWQPGSTFDVTIERAAPHHLVGSPV